MTPERSQLEANVKCSEMMILGLKTTVVYKDHRQTERFKQIFFLGRPQSLVGVPSCKHSTRGDRGKSGAGQSGASFVSGTTASSLDFFNENLESFPSNLNQNNLTTTC